MLVETSSTLRSKVRRYRWPVFDPVFAGIAQVL
jgi:hypothetical protein